MKENIYIKGLNRQAKFFGLPLPLAATAFYPGFLSFIFFDSMMYLILIPVIWFFLWLAVLVNPHFASFLAVTVTKTPEQIFWNNSGIRYG